LNGKNEITSDDWLSSKEMQKHLQISGCELMHQREFGKLSFKKIGNAYYYSINDPKSDSHKDER
jgi:hypothetical protein